MRKEKQLALSNQKNQSKLCLHSGDMCSPASHRSQDFSRLALVTKFPALGTGYMFSRAWHWLHVFPRLAPVTRLGAFAADFTILFAYYFVHVKPAVSLSFLSSSHLFCFYFTVFMFYILRRPAMKVTTLARVLRIRNRKSLDAQINRKLAAVVLISRHYAGSKFFLCHSRI